MTCSLRNLGLVGSAGVVLVALGWLFGLPEAAALAVALWVALGITFALCRFGGAPPEVSMWARPPAVTRGHPARLRLEIVNRGRRRSPATRIHGRLGSAGEGVLAIGSLAPGGVARMSIELPTVRRGIVRTGPLWTTVSDPLGWWRRTVEVPAAATLVVRPVVHPLSAAPTGIGARRSYRGGGGRGPGAATVDNEMVGLRPYVRGDDLRLVHWRTSARRNQPHVVQVEPPAEAPAVTVVLDTGTGVGAAAFERAVEAAASVLARVAGDGHRVRLLTAGGTDSGTLGRAGLPSLLDTLAAVHTSSAVDLLGVLRRALAGTSTAGTGAVVLCTPAEHPLAPGSPAAECLALADGRLTVVACAAAGTAAGQPMGLAALVRWDGSAPLERSWTSALLAAPAGGLR